MGQVIDGSDLVGRSLETRDVADDHRWAAYQAFFSLADDRFPAAVHWTLFNRLPSATRADGHAAVMQPFPPMSLPRRMWAGGEVNWLTPIRQGDRLLRRSTIARAEPKQGTAGAFLLASLAHTISRDASVCIEERQDIVFLPPVTGPGEAASRPAPFAPAWEEEASFGPVDLFRYSALTLNSHRIHYDLAYAREVEHYPGLVVHGPLLATTMIHRGLGHVPGHLPVRFTYRAVAPCFAHDRLRIVGRADGQALLLAVLGPDGGLRTSGRLDLVGAA